MSLRRRVLWQLLKIFGLTGFLCTSVSAGIVSFLGSFSSADYAGWWIWFLLSLSSTLIIGAWFAAGKISPILEDLADSLRRVSTGDYSTELAATSHDQIEEVGKEFDRMTTEVGQRTAVLQGDRNRLRTVIDSMVEGVIAINGSQEIVLVNHAACRLFMIRETSSIGRPLWEVVRNTRVQHLVEKCLTRRARVGGEMESRNSPDKILALSVSPLPGEDLPELDLQSGAVIVIADVTELRRLESVRQEFVANASHELKTPLASIQACTETLLNGGAEDEGARDRFLKLIDESSQRLETLVHDMLTLARSESRQRTLNLVDIDFQHVVDVCLARHQQGAERKQISLCTEPPDEPLTLLGDEEALEEIFDNLLGNAVKYTNSGGKVTLRWRLIEGDGVIEVEDTGIGIPGRQLPRIFERFYRVDRHRSRDQGGTGLGLSIVKHLVHSLKGKITVESQLKIGSTFRVRLPAVCGVRLK